MTVTGIRAALVILALSILPCFAQEQAAPQDDGAALVAEAGTLLERIDRRRDEIAYWEELEGRFEGDDRRAVDFELREKQLRSLAELHRVVELVVELEGQGRDATAIRERIEPMMRELPGSIQDHLDEAVIAGSALRARRETAGADELFVLEQRIAREDDEVQRFAQIYFDHLASMQSLELDVEEERLWLGRALQRFTGLLSGRIELTLERRAELEEQLAANREDAAAKSGLSALDKRLESNVESMKAAVEIMKELDLEAVRQEELIVRTTGDLSRILDTDVAASLVERLYTRAKEWVGELGPALGWKILVFVVILLVFRTLAGMARRLTVRALKSSRVDISKLLENMITSMVGRAVMILGFLVALAQLGVSLGPVLAGLGVAGFVIGFALQDTLSNFASGMMILFYRPFDVDDLVEVGGVSGKVSRMTLVSTTILTLDHQTLIVPNSRIWGDVIKNVTAQKVRRVDMIFGISYQDDIPQAERVLAEIVEGHPKVLEDPAPMVRLHTLGESSVDFVVRPWAATDDYWDVYWDVTREVKLRFDRDGISIPFPQRDVHVYPTDEKAGG